MTRTDHRPAEAETHDGPFLCPSCEKPTAFGSLCHDCETPESDEDGND